MTKDKLEYMHALATMMLKCKTSENHDRCAGVCEDTIGYDAIVRDGIVTDKAPVVSHVNIVIEKN